MPRLLRLFCLCSLGLLATWQLGCNSGDSATDAPPAESADDHDGHDHAGDHGHDDELGLHEALSKIESLAATINQSLNDGDADAVHDSLHEIGHLLEDLPALAEAHGLSEADQQKLSEASTQMMDAYGAVDATLHGDEGKSWDEVKETIDASLKTLQSLDHAHE